MGLPSLVITDKLFVDEVVPIPLTAILVLLANSLGATAMPTLPSSSTLTRSVPAVVKIISSLTTGIVILVVPLANVVAVIVPGNLAESIVPLVKFDALLEKFLVATSCAFTGSVTLVIVLLLLSSPFLARNLLSTLMIPFPHVLIKRLLKSFELYMLLQHLLELSVDEQAQCLCRY